MVRQNKWRAARFGTRAQLVNSYTHEVQPVGQIVESLIHWLTPTAEALSCVDELRQVQRIADGPSWADRQIAILDETGDRREVVRRLTAESRMT